MKARRRVLAGLVLAAAAVCVAIAAGGGPRHVVRAIDGKVPGEPLKEAWGRYVWKEDWASAQPIATDRVDSTWLDATRGQEVRIAHALGAGGSADADTLAAMRSSAARGFRFFEVDLWLDGSGVLRCFHGDDDGGAPEPFRAGDCTFEQVLAELGPRSWLILDIKSDFDRTGSEIVRRLRASPDASRKLIFQLYHPADLASFDGWSRELPLAAPLVTTYASHRSIRHVLAQLQHLNVHAATVPLDRLNQLPQSDPSRLILTHPVHDCDAFRRARQGGARGFYTISSLSC